MRTREIRSLPMSPAPDFESVIWARDRAVDEYCEEHGKDREHLEVADIVAIRATAAWQMAGVLR